MTTKRDAWWGPLLGLCALSAVACTSESAEMAPDVPAGDGLAQPGSPVPGQGAAPVTGTLAPPTGTAPDPTVAGAGAAPAPSDASSGDGIAGASAPAVPSPSDPTTATAPMIGGGDPNPDSSYEPWPGYWEEYPAKYHYLMYDPAKHPGAIATTPEQAIAGGVAPPEASPEHDCALNPPTEEQIREANRIAVETAMFLETLPIFKDKYEANEFGSQYGIGAPFGLGLDFIYDTAGWHYTWGSGLTSPGIDPSNPEVLDYLQTDEGFVPIGVMIMASGAGPGPDFGGCLTFWHIHDALGPIGGALGYMLHIYVYGNPTGPYNEPYGCTANNYPDCVNQALPWPLDNPRHGE